MSVTPLKSVSRENLKQIANGGAFLGSGGGGDPYVGRLMAEQVLWAGAIDVVSIDDLPDDAMILPVCMMRAPQVMQEKFPSGAELEKCVRTMERLKGKTVSALFRIEAGA